MAAKVHKPSVPKRSLEKLDQIRRGREIASYQRSPGQSMPIVFNVKEEGAVVVWPNKFK